MKKSLDIKKIYPFTFILSGIFIYILSISLGLGFLRYPFSYIFEPIYFKANESSDRVKEWGTALYDASSFISEYKSVKEELLETKSQSQGFNLLREENEKLRKQIKISNGKHIYSLGKVLNISDDGILYLNIGSKDGVEVGNIVIVGNVFLGMVSEVDLNGCSVRSVYNKGSSYEVIIISDNIDIDESLNISSRMILSSAVMTGLGNGIKIENIGMNSKVKDGDLVLIRDERVNDILVVGNVYSLSSNPASTYKDGIVQPILSLNDLVTVFVRVNQND